MPFDPTTYRPDPLVVEGGNWMRTLGLKPYQYASARVGNHLHILNCMFDMVTLAAVVEPHSSGYPRVTKTTRCHICEPPEPVEPWDGFADWSDHPDHAKHVQDAEHGIRPTLASERRRYGVRSAGAEVTSR